MNSWAVYNWENGTKMCQKEFILQVCRAVLKEVGCEPKKSVITPGSDEEPDVLSPTAATTPVVARFSCKGEQVASIARSRKYK